MKINGRTRNLEQYLLSCKRELVLATIQLAQLASAHESLQLSRDDFFINI